MRHRNVHERLSDRRDQALMRSLGAGMSTISDRAPERALQGQSRRGLLSWMRGSGSVLGTGLIWLGTRLGGRSSVRRGIPTTD